MLTVNIPIKMSFGSLEDGFGSFEALKDEMDGARLDDRFIDIIRSTSQG